MKTEEDEAFEAIARRQGGFQAKRQMAMDKLQEPICDKDPHGCWNVRCQLGKQCKNLAQPAQEPVAFLDWYENAIWGNEDFQDGCHRAWDAALEHTTPPQPSQEPVAWYHDDFGTLELSRIQRIGWKPLYTTPPQPAQEPVAFLDWYENAIWGNEDFQDGCHRAWDAALEHTTPPQREWVGLTDDEVNNFAAGCHLGKSVQGAIYEAEAKLKEKNNGT